MLERAVLIKVELVQEKLQFLLGNHAFHLNCLENCCCATFIFCNRQNMASTTQRRRIQVSLSLIYSNLRLLLSFINLFINVFLRQCSQMSYVIRSEIERGHRSGVQCVQYDPLNSRLYTAGCDSIVRVWNTKAPVRLINHSISFTVIFRRRMHW